LYNIFIHGLVCLHGDELISIISNKGDGVLDMYHSLNSSPSFFNVYNQQTATTRFFMHLHMLDKYQYLVALPLCRNMPCAVEWMYVQVIDILQVSLDHMKVHGYFCYHVIKVHLVNPLD